MAVAFDAVGPSSAGATSSASATLTWTHTNVGDGVALVVAVAVGDSSDTGVTMTAKLDPSGANTTIPSLGALIHSGASTAGFVGLFGLPNVSTGAHEITVTCSAAVDNMKGGSTSYTGADLTTAFSAQQSFTQQGTAAPSITFTGSTADNMISAGLAHGQSITSVTTGTSRWIRNVDSNSAGGNGAQADKAAGGSQAITWAATSDWCGIAAVEVLATAGPVEDRTSYRPSWVMPRIRQLLGSPFLQAPVTYWPSEVSPGAIQSWTAETGTQGVALTSVTVPYSQAATNGTGCTQTFDNAHASGTLAYQYHATSGQQATGRVALDVTSLTYSLRFVFYATTTGRRQVFAPRHASGNVIRFQYDESALSWTDSANTNLVVASESLPPGFYEVGVQLVVAGASTGHYSIDIYNVGSDTPLNGSPYTSDTYNLGTAVISHLDFGVNDVAAFDTDLWLDDVQAQPDQTAALTSISSAGSTVTPATVATAAGLPSPTIQTGSTVAATVAATVSGVPAPTVQAGSAVSPAVISTATALPAPTVLTGSNATPTPAVIATVTAVGSPTVQTGSVASPAAIASVSAVGSPTVQTGSSVSPATIATTSAIPAPTVAAGASTAPATAATTTALPAPTVQTSSVVTPATVATTAALPAPAIQTGSNVTASPAAIATVTALSAPAVQTGSTVTPAVAATTTGLPAPTVQTGSSSTVTPAVIATTASVATVTVQTGSTVTAATVATVAAVPAPSVQTGSSTTVTAVAVVTVTTLPAPGLSTGSRLSPATVATLAAVPTPTVLRVTFVAAVTVATSTAFPAPTTGAGASVSPTTVATVTAFAAVTVIAPAVYGTGSARQRTGASGSAGSSNAATGRSGSSLAGSGTTGRG